MPVKFINKYIISTYEDKRTIKIPIIFPEARTVLVQRVFYNYRDSLVS